MKSLKKINMDKLIFVCYQHGFGGENLSHRISNHALCDNLLVKIEKGRTIIKNDVFNNNFIMINLNSSNVSDLVGMTVNNSRALLLDVLRATSGTDVRFDSFLCHLRATTVFTSNVTVLD